MISMAQRQLVIVKPARGRQKRTLVTVNIHDATPVGALVSTLAAEFGYPLTDSFGTPISYRLRPLSGGDPLSNALRFADVQVRPGSHFIIEAGVSSNTTVPIPDWALVSGPSERPLSPSSFNFLRHLPRRSFLATGSALALVSVLGLGTGMATAFAQSYIERRSLPSSSLPSRTISSPALQLTLLETFAGHQQTVRTLTWSPDSTMVASGGNDAQVLVWQTNGTVLLTLQMNTSVRAISWSPDGQQLAAAIGNTVIFLHAQTGASLAQNDQVHTKPVTALAWNRMGTSLLVSGGDDNKAAVWNGVSHQLERVFIKHTAPILAVATLSDSVATASEGGLVRVWNPLSGLETHGYLSETAQAQRAVALASTRLLAVGGDDGIVRLWQNGLICTQQKQDIFGIHCIDVPQHLQGHTGPVRSIAFSPDGALLATGADDGKLIIWSMKSMTPIITQQVQNAVASVAWSDSGQLIAVASGTRVTIWQLHS